MPSHHRKHRGQWTPPPQTLSRGALSQSPQGTASDDRAHGLPFVAGAAAAAATAATAQQQQQGGYHEGLPTSIASSPKQLKRTASSLVGGDVDEDIANSGGGANVNGVTSASPALSHSSVSSPSESEVSRAAAASMTVADMANTAAAASGGAAIARRPQRGGGSEVLLLDRHHDCVDDDAGRDEAAIAASAAAAGVDHSGELFYVELDPESHMMTGVLPEVQRLHVRLTQLVCILRRRVERLRVLRDRARRSGDDLGELLPSSPLQPPRPTTLTAASLAPSSGHRRTDTMTSVGSGAASVPHAAGGEGEVTGVRVSSARLSPHPSPVQDQDVSTLSPRTGANSRLASARRPVQQPHPMPDNDSEWCDAATMRSSRSTTAQSTPSLQPCQQPPSLQLFEEDELDDDGRYGLFMCTSSAARRSYAARLRPDSVPASMQTTPNMLPSNSTPYARSDNGGLLSLPPSTLAIGRTPPLLQHPVRFPSPARGVETTSLAMRGLTPSQPEGISPRPPHAARASERRASTLSSSTAVMSAVMVENTPPPPPDAWAMLSVGTPQPPLQGLTEEERKELHWLSWRVAELYSRRGSLLQQADRLLCRHAQQHERWEGNEERRGCYRCRRLFSHLTRRHHCRRCGRLCCAECSRYVGKKQDTSVVGVQHRVIIKSEYSARITAEDTHELVEERFDEHTYPRRSAGDSLHTSEYEVEAQDAGLAASDGEVQLRSPGFEHGSDAAGGVHSRSRQHQWVRVCAPCYQNCLRARRSNVPQQLKSANLCILDDGYYYYHVMTSEELCSFSTALNKPDSFKKQVELMSHVVVERSADYVAAAPGYSAQTLTAAAQHTPDVLRTLGSLGVYAFLSARQTANDYVSGYFAASRAIPPDNHSTALAPHPLSSSHNTGASTSGGDGSADGAGDDDDDDDDQDTHSEVSLMSVDDVGSDTQSPLRNSEERHSHGADAAVDASRAESDAEGRADEQV
ncbi:FYVE zinc finger containing protein [Novymonas esmeraldas]|uniref:FYVE zinc finger containing protein n=1 Tax=Novymonas esmeraldas TaxID=1808958 RepID=A0AAW0EYE9_9TRYP